MDLHVLSLSPYLHGWLLSIPQTSLAVLAAIILWTTSAFLLFVVGRHHRFGKVAAILLSNGAVMVGLPIGMFWHDLTVFDKPRMVGCFVPTLKHALVQFEDGKARWTYGLLPRAMIAIACNPKLSVFNLDKVAAEVRKERLLPYLIRIVQGPPKHEYQVPQTEETPLGDLKKPNLADPETRRRIEALISESLIQKDGKGSYVPTEAGTELYMSACANHSLPSVLTNGLNYNNCSHSFSLRPSSGAPHPQPASNVLP